MAAIPFNWWLLIVGLVVGAGLTWLILGDLRRREDDLLADELPAERAWITAQLRSGTTRLEEADIEQVLRLHQAWLTKTPQTADQLTNEGDADDQVDRPPP